MKPLPREVIKIIRLSYAIAACHFAWFWLPIWVLFYRRFTDFAGVGIYESLTMAVASVSALPSGVLADRIGKRKTLIISGIISTIGGVITGYAWNAYIVGIGVVVLTLGGSVYQSSMEAFQYDTLKSHKREDAFPHVLSVTTMIRMVTCGISSIIGGLLYVIDPRLPFFAVSLMTLIGAVLATKVTEPLLDSNTVDLGSVLHQIGTGLRSIFKENVRRASILFILLGVFFTADSSGFWDIQAVSYGLSSQDLGILYTVLYAVMAVVSVYFLRLSKRFSVRTVLFGSSFMFALSMLASSAIGGVIGGTLLILRSAYSVIFDMRLSIIMNGWIPSSVRSTTLSAISTMRGIPYILFAYALGSVVDRTGTFPIAIGLGLAVLIVSIGILSVYHPDKQNT